MNELTFDKEKHVYTYDGKTVASVTHVLKASGLIDDRWFDDLSRERGKAVHKAVSLSLINDLDYAGLHAMIKPYVDAFLKFKSLVKFEPIIKLCERRQINLQYNYAGTPDIVCTLNNRPALIDIKTGASATARYQTAAYSEFQLIKCYRPDRFDLRLFPDGTYKLNRHDDPNDFNVFLSALNIVKLIKK